ncbi:MAG: carboxylesterase type [Proteobacteria bacterium]|nr:carboxylesterase type [Pseudomonadota bacterium]
MAAMFASYKAPIYTLRIAWGGDLDDHRLFSGLLRCLRQSRRQGSDRQLGRYLANFLRTGNPNGDGLVAWKPWESATNGPTQLVVGADAQTAIITIPEAAKTHLIESVLNGRWFSHRLDRHFGNPLPWIGVE